jgi:hypothetical protein
MRRRLLIVVLLAAALTVGMLGLARAQSGRAAHPSRDLIHVVLPATGAHIQFFDFDHDGLGFGDRLAAVSPILDQSQTRRLGTSYLDCWIGNPNLVDGSIYDCTYVLKFADGEITTQGLDPQGPSDVLFSVTGGTGAYRGVTGQAEYIDTTVTDIIIDLDE